MATKLTYAIKYVENMDRAVTFHKEHLGLAIKFESPHWSEFETGGTTLALHPATAEHPVGSCQLGFGVRDVAAFYAEKKSQGVVFTSAPTMMHGKRIARFTDSEGAECTISGS